MHISSISLARLLDVNPVTLKGFNRQSERTLNLSLFDFGLKFSFFVRAFTGGKECL